MQTESALPVQGQSAPEASGQPDNAALPQGQRTDEGQHAEGSQGERDTAAAAGAEEGAGKKPEKTPEQREIERLRRGIDRRTRQLAEARAQLGVGRPAGASSNQQVPGDDDSEPLTLTRAELQQRIKDEALRLAPTLRSQEAETERRQGVIQSLAKTWGQERFDQVASDLDDALGGLADSSGRPKPAIEAVFEADDPARVIEYLADPDNADEAESIARMNSAQAGKAIAKLEAKLGAKPAAPQTPKAPPPIEPIRGRGESQKHPSDMSDKEFAAYRRGVIANRR